MKTAVMSAAAWESFIPAASRPNPPDSTYDMTRYYASNGDVIHIKNRYEPKTGTDQSDPGSKNPAKAYEDDVRSWR